MTNLKELSAAALAAVGLAVTDLIGIAIVEQMKTSGLVDNTTADLFIAGLVVFGTFLSLIVLVLVGKILIGLIRGGMGGN